MNAKMAGDTQQNADSETENDNHSLYAASKGLD